MINYICLSEIIVVAIIIVVIAFKLGKKSIKKMLIFEMLFVFLLAIGLVVTVSFENPQLDIEDKVTLQIGTMEQISKPHATYMFHDVSNKIEIIGDIDYSKIGEYEITYEVPMLFKKYTKTQKMDILDTLEPDLTLEGDAEIKQSYAKEYEELGYKAIDNYDGDITDKVVVEKTEVVDNQFEVKYSVSDSSGNTTSKTRKVTIIDDVAPTITLNGKSKINVIVGNNYSDEGAKAYDEKDGDLTGKIQKSGNVDTSKIDNYTITYKVSDNSGNIATATRTICVIKQKVQAQTGIDGAPGTIYLTFDDGPSTNVTPQILDILKSRGIQATFFVVNYNSTGEKMIIREYNEGHTIGIHGYSHEYKKIYQSVDAFMNNVTSLQEKIKATTGYTPTIIRFPGGSSNTVSKFNPGIMTTLTSVVQERGYKYFDWNVSCGDGGNISDPNVIYNNVVNSLKKDRANVVLMHDTNAKTSTLNALEKIIDYAIENGYTFSKITENTPMVTHSVNN